MGKPKQEEIYLTSFDRNLKKLQIFQLPCLSLMSNYQSNTWWFYINSFTDDSPSTSSSKPKVGSNKRRKRRESGSSDEERWLTAIESGKLEDVDDELKKIKPKDPSLMTARQRAIYDRGSEGSTQTIPTLMSLPTGYKVCFW